MFDLRFLECINESLITLKYYEVCSFFLYIYNILRTIGSILQKKIQCLSIDGDRAHLKN